MTLHYGWDHGKFVLLVTAKGTEGPVPIARISLNTVEAQLVSNSIDLEKSRNCCHKYEGHEQII